MDQLFSPPGREWRPVSPQLGVMRRTVLLVLTAVLALATLVVGLVMSPPLWLVVVVVTALVVLALSGWVVIDRNARMWGYAERDEDLYIKHGALFREMVVVPYGRMQFVDVQSGPVERFFGISSVHLHTASPGTSARIPGLVPDEAARLRDRLTQLGEAQAAGL